MSEIDQKINEIKNGQVFLENSIGNYNYYIVYLAGDFFFETYKYNHATNDEELHHVICVDEETVRFSLTVKF